MFSVGMCGTCGLVEEYRVATIYRQRYCDMKGALFVFSLYGMAVVALHDLERLAGCGDMDFIVFVWVALVLVGVILVFIARILVRWGLESRREAHERLEWYYGLYPEERVPYSGWERFERHAVAVACRALGVTTHWYAGHGYVRQCQGEPSVGLEEV